MGLASFLCAGGQAFADALVRTEAMRASTIAEVFVEADSIRVALEIGASDVPVFARIMPDELYEKLGNEPEPFEKRLQSFFTEDWVVRVDGGEPIQGEMRALELRPRVLRDDITGEPIPADGDEEKVVFAQFEFPLPTKPSSISLSPPGGNNVRTTSATIGFVLYHESVAVNDFRYLGQEETVDLDWEDPWYSAFRNRNLKRQYSAPVQGFIYVEPFEVRKEILVRPKDLQHWIDLGLEGAGVIPASAQEELKEKVAQFLAEHCPVTVDGAQVPFKLDRVHFVERTLRQTRVLEEATDLPVVSAMLGVIFVHQRSGLPKEAAMTWDLFNEKITSMRGATHDEAGAFPWTVTPDDPVLKWTNYLKNPTLPTFEVLKPPPLPRTFQLPVLSVLCGLVGIVGALLLVFRRNAQTPKRAWSGVIVAFVGVAAFWPLAKVSIPVPSKAAESISNKESTELIAGLLRNIYRAFEYRDEEVVYDNLARSVSGDLLTEIYIEVRKALELRSQGGAKLKVAKLEVVESEREPGTEGPGFRMRCRWNVTGTVNHWGHVHTRINQYEAKFDVNAVGGQWKITDQEFVGAQRVG